MAKGYVKRSSTVGVTYVGADDDASVGSYYKKKPIKKKSKTEKASPKKASPKIEDPPGPVKLVDVLRDEDVRMGRNTGFMLHQGNVFFRDTVRAHQHAFHAETTTEGKIKVAENVYETIIAYGGRFVDSGDSGLLYEVPLRKCLSKINKALREMKRNKHFKEQTATKALASSGTTKKPATPVAQVEVVTPKALPRSTTKRSVQAVPKVMKKTIRVLPKAMKKKSISKNSFKVLPNAMKKKVGRPPKASVTKNSVRIVKEVLPLRKGVGRPKGPFTKNSGVLPMKKNVGRSKGSGTKKSVQEASQMKKKAATTQSSDKDVGEVLPVKKKVGRPKGSGAKKKTAIKGTKKTVKATSKGSVTKQKKKIASSSRKSSPTIIKVSVPRKNMVLTPSNISNVEAPVRDKKPAASYPKLRPTIKTTSTDTSAPASTSENLTTSENGATSSPDTIISVDSSFPPTTTTTIDSTHLESSPDTTISAPSSCPPTATIDSTDPEPPKLRPSVSLSLLQALLPHDTTIGDSFCDFFHGDGEDIAELNALSEFDELQLEMVNSGVAPRLPTTPPHKSIVHSPVGWAISSFASLDDVANHILLTEPLPLELF